MLNLSRFNRTKFNSAPLDGIPIYGVASMEMTTTGHFFVDRYMAAEANMHCTANGVLLRFFFCQAAAEMHSGASASFIRYFFVSSKADMVMTTLATGYRTYGAHTLSLGGLSLAPGDEVVIDTDNMTVTINGQNAVGYLSADSEFFRLLPGENSILLEADGSFGDLYFIWKDRWL